MTLQTLSITFISMGVGACMAAAQDRGLCPHVLARLAPQRVLTLHDEMLARVEVRDCPAWGESIQLSGWERDAGTRAEFCFGCRLAAPSTTDERIGIPACSRSVTRVSAATSSRCVLCSSLNGKSLRSNG